MNRLGFTVSLGCIPTSTPYWTAASNTFPTSNLISVYSAPYTTTVGWNMINLTNSYNWDGVSDLLVQMCFTGQAFSGMDVVQKTTSPNNCVLYASSGAALPLGCNILTGSVSNLLPNMKFQFCSIDTTGTTGYFYEWTALPAKPNPFLSSPYSAHPIVAPLSTTKFYVSLLGTTPCVIKDSVTIHALATFSSVHTPHDTVCKGALDTLFCNSVGSGNTIVKWHWQSMHGNPIDCDTCQFPVVTVNTADTIISIIRTALGCAKVDTIVIDTFKALVADFVMSKTANCSKEAILITSKSITNANGKPVTYTWNFDNPYSSVSGSGDSSYTVSWLNIGSTPIIKHISLSVTQNGCTSPTIIKIDTVHIIPTPQISANENVFCSGYNIVVSSTGSITEDSSKANYIWTSKPIQSTPAVITGRGPNTLTFNLNVDSSTVVTEYLQIIENGCVSNIDSTQLTVRPIPSARFIATPNPSCSGNVVTFTFNGKLDPVTISNGHTLTWTFVNGNPPSATGSDIVQTTFNNSTEIVAGNLATVTVTQNSCKSAPYSDTVFVNPLPQPIVSGPKDICANQIAVLTTSVPYKFYTWKDGYGNITHNDTLSINKDELISVDVVDYNNCKGGTTTQVTVHPSPEAHAGIDQTIFLGNSAYLDGSNSAGGDAYLWTPYNTLNDAHSMTPIATPNATTAYVLTYFNSTLGCTDNDTVIIHVKDCKPLILPNAFTPNGDGEDDYFMIINPDDYYKLVHMEIYNRWGQLIFSTNDKNSKGWDGRYLGELQQIDTYIFNITAECGGGKLLQLKGDVTLLR